MESASSPSPVKALEEAVEYLWNHNFDADSKICIVTILKLLDNVLQKPADPKVRQVRLENKAFATKVASRPGGVEILLACGFEKQRVESNALLLLNAAAAGEELLVLSPQREDVTWLVKARQYLANRAIQTLGMKEEELPAFRPPPPKIQLVGTANNNNNIHANTNSAGNAVATVVEFNPYKGHRFDGKSAALGQQQAAALGPEPNYISPTEAQLTQLQQRQEKLEQELHSHDLSSQRNWYARRLPGAIVRNDDEEDNENNTSTTASVDKKTDQALLADKMKKQAAERVQRETGGFTTKAMRDLQALKKQKVYSHVVLTIQFPDGAQVIGKFLPKETISTVVTALQQDCLNSDCSDATMELFVTPPRRLLKPTNTLQDEGLVPAAKVFVSWKGSNTMKSSSSGSGGVNQNKEAGWFLRPTLFPVDDNTKAPDATALFPEARPLLPTNNESQPNDKDDDKDKKPPATGLPKPSKEQTLLARMMGGGKPSLGGASASSAATNDDKKPSANNNTDKKPKWFK